MTFFQSYFEEEYSDGPSIATQGFSAKNAVRWPPPALEMTRQSLQGYEAQYKWFPFKSCDQFDDYHSGQASPMFCGFNKLLLLIAIVLILAFSYQLYIQRKQVQKGKKSCAIGIQ